MVSISAPSACTASKVQERAASPSKVMVQTPQTPCSQPIWVPVRLRSSRRKSTSSLRGSQCAATDLPLTVIVTNVSWVMVSSVMARSVVARRRHAPSVARG
jgi:hypothetical protein